MPLPRCHITSMSPKRSSTARVKVEDVTGDLAVILLGRIVLTGITGDIGIGDRCRPVAIDQFVLQVPDERLIRRVRLCPRFMAHQDTKIRHFAVQRSVGVVVRHVPVRGVGHGLRSPHGLSQ